MRLVLLVSALFSLTAIASPTAENLLSKVCQDIESGTMSASTDCSSENVALWHVAHATAVRVRVYALLVLTPRDVLVPPVLHTAVLALSKNHEIV